MIDLALLAEKLDKLGLLNKTFMSMTRPEIESLCSAVMSCPSDDVPPTGWQKPYLSEDGTLVIPSDVHPRYKWWCKDSMSLLDILAEIEASADIIAQYKDPMEGKGIKC